MAETKQATKERMSYEIIERNGDKISSIIPITTGQTISITEGSSFSIRISKIGSDTTRWGGYSYWHIKSDQDISTVWTDQAEINAPWSFWNNNSRSKISTGLYLPVQDSINWETAKITDGAPPIQYKEDWDSNLIYTPYVEYKIKTTDDNIYSGDKLISIKLSLDASSIKTSSARQHNTGNNVITVDSSLSSADFNVRVSENDEQVNKVYATSYQGREGEWVTIRFRRIGDITQYAGINVQASGFTYPNSPATTIANLYPYENYSSGWHGDWSLDQGNSISGNRVLVFAPGESEVAFQILLRSDNYPEKTERLSFNVEDLGNLYSNRTYNGKHLQKITIEGSTYVDILDASSTHSLSPSSTSINEGSTLTTTVSTTNVTPGTALYYSLSGTGITSADFSSGSLTGSGTVSSSGSFSFSHTLANDLTTEGTESLEIKLYSDSSRSTQVASTSVSINDTSLTPTSNVTVNGNNNGIANAGTINNNGTINTGTINTNSGNTTNNTTNTTVNNTNITYNYYTNTTNNVNSNNTTNNVNSNNTLNTWNIFRVDATVKAADIVNQWFGTAAPTAKQSQDVTDTKLLDINASTWSDKIQINRVAKATDNGDILEALMPELGGDPRVGSVLNGGAGKDVISGRAGWDVLEGGDDNDLIHGGNGRDIITGGAGRDELHGDFGWNTYKSEKDGVSDLIAIKSDQYLVNWIYGKAGNNADGSKCDIIEGLDAIDKIRIIGVDTRDITFAANVTAKGLTGIGIYGKGALEALYTGGDLTINQITQMTSGDASAAAMANQVNSYGVW